MKDKIIYFAWDDQFGVEHQDKRHALICNCKMCRAKKDQVGAMIEEDLKRRKKKVD